MADTDKTTNSTVFTTSSSNLTLEQLELIHRQLNAQYLQAPSSFQRVITPFGVEFDLGEVQISPEQFQRDQTYERLQAQRDAQRVSNVGFVDISSPQNTVEIVVNVIRKFVGLPEKLQGLHIEMCNHPIERDTLLIFNNWLQENGEHSLALLVKEEVEKERKACLEIVLNTGGALHRNGRCNKCSSEITD